MSLTTRRTLAWLIGYPMSVAVAAAIIFLPFIYGDFPHPGRNTSLAVVDESAALFFAVVVVAAWSAIPAIVTWGTDRRHPRLITHFTRNGMITGLIGGVLVALLRFSYDQRAIDAGLGIEWADAIRNFVSVCAGYAVAGGAGGFVFGWITRWTEKDERTDAPV